MLNQIIRFSLDHRALMIMLALVLVASGLASLARLPIDAFPDTSPCRCRSTHRALARARDIEAQITFPMEQVISGLPGLARCARSRSSGCRKSPRSSRRDRHFPCPAAGWRTIDTAELPEKAGVNKPEIGPIATGLGEVYHYLLTSDRLNLTDSARSSNGSSRPSSAPCRAWRK